MTKNFTTGILGIIIGSIYLLAIQSFPEARAGDATGPKFFPLLIGSISIISGVFLCLMDRKKRSEAFQWGFTAEREILIMIGISTVLGVIYGLVIEGWGYLLSTAIFLFCIIFMINRGRLIQNIIFSLLFPVVTYLLFAVVLHLSLPRGIIENILPF